MAFARACGCRGLKRRLLPPLCVATFPVFPGGSTSSVPSSLEKKQPGNPCGMFFLDAASSSSPPGTWHPVPEGPGEDAEAGGQQEHLQLCSAPPPALVAERWPTGEALRSPWLIALVAVMVLGLVLAIPP